MKSVFGVHSLSNTTSWPYTIHANLKVTTKTTNRTTYPVPVLNNGCNAAAIPDYIIRSWQNTDTDSLLTAYMVIACSLLPKNNGNLPLPFFGGNYPIVLLYNIYQLLYMYTNWFAWIIYFFMIVYVIRKTGGNKNDQNSLNVMVNYHYHRKNRIITQ